MHTRNNDIKNIDSKTFDVAIIGGGITGSGIANILSENSINAILIEKNDFASGTSSGSSKLIHGGLRYLSTGHIMLVRELIKERNYLLKNVNIVKKIKFDVLTGKSQWNKHEIKFGLFLYSMLENKFKMPEFSNGNYTENIGIDGYFTYEDAMTDDSTMVIYNIASAYNNGVLCFNYLELLDFKKDNDYSVLICFDKINKKYITIKARLIINCTGPWANRVNKVLKLPENSEMKLSKGIHIIFNKDYFNIKNALVFRSSIDKRQLFLIPRDHVCILGTTDKFIDNPDDFSINDNDIEYLINSTKKIFTFIDKKDIIASYSGIRPLIGKGSDPGKISRDFKIIDYGNIITVFGGKLTDYRVAARKALKIIKNRLKIDVKIRNMPYINYSRPDKDQVEFIISHECPVYVNDLLRRRLPVLIYDPGNAENFKKENIDKLSWLISD